jgi:hypothetical protein
MRVKRIVPEVTITTLDGTVTLHNAQVLGVAPAEHGSYHDTHELDVWSFTFHKIEVSNCTGGIAGADDWSEYPP